MALSALGIASISALIAIFTWRIPGWEAVLALLTYISGWILKEYPLKEIKGYFQERGRFLIDISVFVVALCCALMLSSEKAGPISYFSYSLFWQRLTFLGIEKKSRPSFGSAWHVWLRLHGKSTAGNM